MSTRCDYNMRVESIAQRAAAYGMPGHKIDGMDLNEVYEATAGALADVREGAGPVLIEADCYRFSGHSKSDRFVYRTREEEQEWAERDPLPNARRRLVERGLDEAELEQAEDRVREHVAAAYQAAQESPEPEAAEVLVSPYAEPLTDE
jgi:pyruvate dehydrogenase E1 component alpha subunit